MSGHTRGPWHKEGPDEFGDYNIVPDSEISAIGAAVQQMLDPADPSVGAVVNNGRTPEEVAANADLFAAAPDLLAELKRLVAALEPLERNGNWPLDGAGIATLNAARAAIAAAEPKP